MTVTQQQGPWPEGHPLRNGFVTFGLRPPQANSGDAPPANSAETEDDPEGIRMELLRRARARAMVASAIKSAESVAAPQTPVEAPSQPTAPKESSGDTGAS